MGTRPIAVVLGTRPEIIKLAPVIAALGDRARVVHTGQHYDVNLDGVFFTAFGLPDPEVRIKVGGLTRGEQIAEATRALSQHFAESPPLAVVCQGDTNSTLGASLAANAAAVPLVHIEAGLRSFDRAMPEEHNRVLADHLADLCCAPTEVSRANLTAEAIPDDRIEVTGNTVVEALATLLPGADERAAALESLGLAPSEFVLSTFHRPENVDDAATLEIVLRQLASTPLPTVLPLHPRTVARVEEFGLGRLLDGIVVTEPLDYRTFLGLAAESALLISDSGGIQEEASIIKRPVIVVRNSTERPEVLGTFAERLLPGPAVGRLAAEWIDDLGALHQRLAQIETPYGDGTAARRSVAALDEMLSR